MPGIVLLALDNGPGIQVERLDRVARRRPARHEARTERGPAASAPPRFRIGVVPAPGGAELGARFVF